MTGPVLLIYPKTNPFPHSISAPLSVFSLGAYLEQRNVAVEYFDERVQRLSDLSRILRDRRPGMVGISCMTGYQIWRGEHISRIIRDFDDKIPIVWGGIHPSMEPMQTISSEYVDFVIKGEGEESLFELYEAIISGKRQISDIGGIYWKNGATLFANKERGQTDVNELPFPYSGKALELLPRYSRSAPSRPAVAYQITRGCSFNCSFCYNAFFNQSKARTLKREKFVSELKMIKGLGYSNVYFYDNNLGLDKHFVKDLCRIMAELKMRWCGSLRVNVIDEEIANDLINGGCDYLFIGIESMSDSQLKRINKGQSSKQIKECIAVLAGKVDKTYSFLCCLPGEDKAYLYEMMNFIDWVRRIDPKAGVALHPYAPLPGTALYREAIENGFSAPRKLIDWWDYTTGNVVGPWVRNRNLFFNLYLITFFAFRYEKFLPKICFPIHLLAKLRWRLRFFSFCFERFIFNNLKRYYLFVDSKF